MNPADRAILHELLEKWFLCMDSGEPPDLREHGADRPELAPELARLLERAGAIDDLFATPSGPQSETAPPPERLSDFELITPIRSGGAGEVYLARLPHVPVPLFPHLETRGLSWRVHEEPYGVVLLAVFRA